MPTSPFLFDYVAIYLYSFPSITTTISNNITNTYTKKNTYTLLNVSSFPLFLDIFPLEDVLFSTVIAQLNSLLNLFLYLSFSPLFPLPWPSRAFTLDEKEHFASGFAAEKVSLFEHPNHNILYSLSAILVIWWSGKWH